MLNRTRVMLNRAIVKNSHDTGSRCYGIRDVWSASYQESKIIPNLLKENSIIPKILEGKTDVIILRKFARCIYTNKAMCRTTVGVEEAI